MPRTHTIRVEFTKEHDSYLIKYIARYCPSKEGRSGHKIYQQLVANEQKRWPWAVHHTAQSWRERYVKHTDKFDAAILKHQGKHDIKPGKGKKRAAEPMPIEMLGPNAKRAKVEAEERVPSSETPTDQGTAEQNANPSTSTLKPTSKHPREPREGRPPREPEPTNARSFSQTRPCPNTDTDATKKQPILDLPALQTRHDTLEITSSSPKKQAPPPTDGQPQPRSPPRPAKRIKERPRAPSEVFGSEPSSPQRDAAAADVSAGGPASQTQQAPSTPIKGVNGASVGTSVYPRAPPRLVDSLQGQVLVDRKGHVPRAINRGEQDVAEEEEEQVQEKAQWPPARGRAAQHEKASGATAEVDAHHPFSQPILQPRPEASRKIDERERGEPHQHFGHVSRKLDGAPPDQPTVAAQFSGEVHHSVAPQVESERREDVVRNGASQVKRVVPPPPPAVATAAAAAPAPPAPPLDLLSEPILKGRLFKPSKFPAPRASTRSPFRPEPPSGEPHHAPPQPQLRLPPTTKAARHPALKRIRRQTIAHGPRNGNGNRNGHEHDRGRQHGDVPSVDLVALSHSSLSTRSHSRSSTGGSVPARPPRRSLPAFAHTMPKVFDVGEGATSAPASGSGSRSPFRWAAPSPYVDVLGRGRGVPSTPSPVRSLVGAHLHTHASSLTPHPPDVPLTASHGLTSILAHMSMNHGLALEVVEAVYARVGSLREADEVLMGMREAAEVFGGREIERRVRGGREERAWSGAKRDGRNGRKGKRKEGEGRGRTRLRYVMASEDGEGSEYSPPETSRAAMWKQQSESASYAEEEEEEEGREVEKELQEGDEQESDDQLIGANKDGNNDAQGVQRSKDDMWVEEVLLDNLRAQELERKVGKAQFRRELVRRFR